MKEKIYLSPKLTVSAAPSADMQRHPCRGLGLIRQGEMKVPGDGCVIKPRKMEATRPEQVTRLEAATINRMGEMNGS